MPQKSGKKKKQTWEQYREVLAKRGYKVITANPLSDSIKDLEYIALYSRKPLGKGSFGNVFKAYPVNKKAHKLVKSKPLAVKYFKQPEYAKKKEADFFGAYHKNTGFFEFDGSVYLAMELLPGKELFDDTQQDMVKLNANIKPFNFAKRCELAANLMMAVNLLHHETPSTGPALIHRDLKGSNIKFQYDQDTGRIDVYIYDFGVAEEALVDADKMQKSEPEGTIIYMPDEVVNDKLGIKSDIYSLAPIIACLFGAKDPFALRGKSYFGQVTKYFKIPYDLTGLFEGYDCPSYTFDAYAALKKFINRMQAEDYHARPDSDEALRFFNTLHIFCLSHANNPDDEAVLIASAKLALMAEGLWDQFLILTREIDVTHKDEMAGDPKQAKTVHEKFEHHDFSSNLPLCRLIVNADRLGKLNNRILSGILLPKKEPAAVSLTQLFFPKNKVENSPEQDEDMHLRRTVG